VRHVPALCLPSRPAIHSPVLLTVVVELRNERTKKSRYRPRAKKGRTWFSPVKPVCDPVLYGVLLTLQVETMLTVIRSPDEPPVPSKVKSERFITTTKSGQEYVCSQR
jgi:hypothetical protein